MFPKTIIAQAASQTNTDMDKVMYKFDFDKGAYQVVDGHLVELTSKEDKIKQWLRFLLVAELDKIEVYKDKSYGLNVSKFIGLKDLPNGLITGELKRQLEEQLIVQPFIKSVDYVKVDFKEGTILHVLIGIKTQDDIKVEVTNV